MKTKILAAMGTAVAIVLGASAALAGPTLNAVKQKGFVQCGVNPGLPGFSNPDSQGNWTGLDVDFCRAVGAAIFGDPKAVRFTPLSAQQRFTALQSGEIDILSRNTTWSLTRDTSLGLNFAPTTFYDGQGFMVPKSLGVSHATELNGATVCVQSGTTTELNLADYFRSKGLTFQPVVIESFDEVNAAFFAGRCDVYTTDASGMASIRSTLAPNPDDYIILPELISKEPLGPAVRRGDDEWAAIVRWVVFGLIEAEEYGVTQANVDQMAKDSKDPVVGRLLGTTEDTGKLLGLDKDWLARAIKATGNYGEIFERNVGPKTALALPRGRNQLWSKGGFMYAPPVR
jgi:general L-amino acid transport system substrate-binding protein